MATDEHPQTIKHQGHTYVLDRRATASLKKRTARTREDVMWAQVAEVAKRLAEMATADQDAVSKRELVRDVWSELRDKIANVGLW